MRPVAVLFDCDGVIVDSEATGLDLLVEDFTALGFAMPRSELEARFVGGTISGLFGRARSMGVPLPDGWVDDFYERLYARLAEGTPLIDGVERLMDSLDAARIPYAVGSNGTMRKMEITLGQHPNVWKRLEGRLFSGQEIGSPKPEPTLYLHAAAALGVTPEGCVVIDDSATGCRAAARAGMRCLGFAAHDDGAALLAEGAEVVRTMDEARARLGL